jgi:hypothetical protein
MLNDIRLRWTLALAVSFVLILAPAIWNGFPLLQYDTGGYLARPFEGYLVPSRPAAYGLLLAASAPFQFWPALIGQSAATLWIVALMLRVYGLGGRPLLFTIVIAGLSTLTTVAFLASILLTDIFAGLGVFALHVLVFRADTLSMREKIALVVFVAFGAATHSATIGVFGALVGAGFVLSPFSRGLIPAAGLRRALAGVLLGVVFTLGANFAVSGKPAWTPGGYGIAFGRLLQDGIVTRYLDEHCPNVALKLCPYRHELPDTADAFLWGDSVFNDLGRFAGLDEEMRTIVLGSLRDHPWLNIKAAFVAACRQLVSVASGEGVLNSIWHTYGIMERYTPGVVPAMKSARQQRGELSFESVNAWHVPVALAAIAVIAVTAGLALLRRRASDLDLLAMTVALALLANAAVCGILSNPHNRYGARLAWIAAFTVGLMIAREAHAPASRARAAVRARG